MVKNYPNQRETLSPTNPSPATRLRTSFGQGQQDEGERVFLN
jgi:hypothetical protein